MPVRRLGLDEHGYRSVRLFPEPAGGWRRFEPCMSRIVDVDSGQVLGVVDGRDSVAIGGWLQQRSQAWRDRIEVVAIDPSAAFRKALREQLPKATVSVDSFHLVKLADDTVTVVRQRLAREQHGRRGRLIDPSWANRRLLLRGAEALTARGWARLNRMFHHDDPTGELGAELRAACAERSPEALIFGNGLLHLQQPTARGGWYITAINRAIAIDPSFPRPTIHDLRHTAASIAISAGANVKAVQRMLGHASAAMTLDVYADRLR
jgi:integrase